MEVSCRIEACEDEYLKAKFKHAVAVIKRTIDLYGLEGMALSFNGGKDCTVLLHVIRAALALRQATPAEEKGLCGIHTFAFISSDDFPEVIQFVKDTDELYDLKTEYLKSDFKAGIEGMLERTPVKAIIIGTRRGDPNAKGQDTYCPSSEDWPQFMRINPILDWTFSDVWTFLRTTHMAYCPLYDKGYTSLGSVGNTVPNSALLKEDGTYAPAYMLADSRLERAGRNIFTDSLSSKNKFSTMTRTAALVIIGDEILSAKVDDVNTMFLLRELRAIGWRVCKVVIVPDEIGAIGAEVKDASDTYEIVITAGGVGPTLDDVTMAGIAEALGRTLHRDPNLESKIREFFGEHTTNAHLKMAEAPEGETEQIPTLWRDGKPSPFPVLLCRNVYVLPGVPSLLQYKWKYVKDHILLQGELQPFHTIVLRLSLTDETEIVDALDKVSAEFGNKIAIGSYPVSKQADDAGIVLSLESKDIEILKSAREVLLDSLPDRAVVTSEEWDIASLNKTASKANLSKVGSSANLTNINLSMER